MACPPSRAVPECQNPHVRYRHNSPLDERSAVESTLMEPALCKSILFARIAFQTVTVTAFLLAFASCQPYKDAESDPFRPMVNGMYFQPDLRHFAIGKNGGIEVRIKPSGINSHAWFDAEMTNSGQQSVWFEPQSTAFFIAPSHLADQIRVIKLSGNPLHGEGLADISEEIPASSSRYFEISVRWGSDILKERVSAELRLEFKEGNGKSLPVVVHYVIGPLEPEVRKRIPRDTGR